MVPTLLYGLDSQGGQAVLSQMLELRHGLAQAYATPTMLERGGRLGYSVASDIPSPGGWVLPTSRLGRPARTQMTTAEYKTAVAQLWGSADPGTQRLLRAAGVPPPDPEEHDLDPRTALSRVTSAYKMATAELRTLVEKKGRLQAKADRAKAEFEKAVQDLASVSQAIEKQTESVAQAQEEVRRKVADQERSHWDPAHGGGRANRGTAECCPRQDGSHACGHHSSAGSRDPCDVWMGEKPAPREYGPWLPGKEAKSASQKPDLALPRLPDRRCGPGQRGERS